MGQDINTDIVLTENLENLTLQNMSLDLLESESDIENNVDYLIAQNDKKSKELLQDKELTIADVAYSTGFSSPNYFSTSLKINTENLQINIKKIKNKKQE